MAPLNDDVLGNLERQHATGLTSSDLIDVCAAHGIALSEATLRKYVQLGLLPRSVRVGRKGKHKGSLGLYPVRVIRQLCRIKEMMADHYTIEEIRRDFLFVRTDIEQLEQTLGSIFKSLARALEQRRREGGGDLVAHEVSRAKRRGRELLQQLAGIEQQLARRSQLGSAAFAEASGASA